jgi:hypothetical protein
MKIISALAFIFIGFTTIFGQAKIVEENDFNILFNKWKQESKQKTYRVRTVSESEINGNPSSRSEESYFEYAPPDKRKFVTELKTPTFNTKIETIQIGEKKYTRKDLGDWKESIAVEEKTPPKGKNKITVETDEFKYIGQEKVNGQNAEIYERNTKHKITSEKNSNESLPTMKVKYSFNKDRLLLKIEMETEIVSGITKSFSLRTSTYEYDLNIKIEAPIK